LDFFGAIETRYAVPVRRLSSGGRRSYDFFKTGGGCEFFVKLAGVVDFVVSLVGFRRARQF